MATALKIQQQKLLQTLVEVIVKSVTQSQLVTEQHLFFYLLNS